MCMPFTAEADARHPFKRQLHTIHVVAGLETSRPLAVRVESYRVLSLSDDCAMLMSPNKDETAVHGFQEFLILMYGRSPNGRNVRIKLLRPVKKVLEERSRSLLPISVV